MLWQKQQGQQQLNQTCNATEKAQIGCGISLVSIGDTFSWGWGHWNGHCDRLMEFPSSWFHSDNWAKCCFVSKDLFHNFIWNRLGLETRERTLNEVGHFSLIRKLTFYLRRKRPITTTKKCLTSAVNILVYALWWPYVWISGSYISKSKSQIAIWDTHMTTITTEPPHCFPKCWLQDHF